MQEAIREGALRLMTSEATCDVIINCQGHRLMAHKVILSIASPLLQELLLTDHSETSFLLLPDISASTMAYILDYIYTGSVLLHSQALPEFLSVANLLKLKVEPDIPAVKQGEPQNYSNKFYNKYSNYENDMLDNGSNNLKQFKDNVNECGPECYNLNSMYNNFKLIDDKRIKFSPIILQDDRTPNLINNQEDNSKIFSSFKTSDLINNQTTVVNNMQVPALKDINGTRKKPVRKIPNLMPISQCRQLSAFKARNGLYNRVFPSPWCPRIVPVTGDPRSDCPRTILSAVPVSNVSCPVTKNPKETVSLVEESNDKNNNLKPTPFYPLNITLSIENNNQSFSSTETRILNNPPDNSNSPYIKYTHQNDKTSSILSPQHSQDGKEIALSETVSSVESNSSNSSSSNAEVRSGEERLLKVDKSDKDNGKEDSNSGDQKQKPYKCTDCGKQFSQLRNYKYHRSVHKGTKEFAARCPECGKVFNDRGYLSSHLKIHRDRKEYGCPHCPKRFNQRVAYNMHLRIHTGVKPHVCPTCSKGFSRKMLLKQHQRVHTGERPYQCPECGKSFADRSNMSLHARLHTGVKPYACNLCPKSFTKKHHLKTHMNYHTGLKPYVCQNCGLTFSQSSNMRTHYKKCIRKDCNETSNNASIN